MVRTLGRALPDQQQLEAYVRFEDALADATAALAKGLEQRGNFRCQFLYSAETAMRRNTKYLDGREFSSARKGQVEALALLVKARDDMRSAFGKNPSARECQKFDREQIQKLRNPKNDDERAEMLASKLKRVATKEQLVYETLGGQPCESDALGNLPNSGVRSPPSPSKRNDASKKQQARSPGKAEAAPTAGQEGSGGQPKSGTPIDRRQLEQRQHEIVLDAYELQQMMQNIDKLTELARRRMTRGTQRAEESANALARGDSDTARESAGDARRQFSELARHVAGLSARDIAGRVGAARDLAAELAETVRALANRLDASRSPNRSRQNVRGKQSGPANSPSASPAGNGDSQFGSQNHGQTGNGPRDFGQLAEEGKTLRDLIDALARAAEADGELASKIAGARAHARLDSLVARMQTLNQRPDKRATTSVSAEPREIADRLELLAHELSAIHGVIVAPRLTQLLHLEKQTAQLRDRLGTLASDAEITQWHLDAQTLMQALEKTGIGNAEAAVLRQAMSDAGWGQARTRWGWEHSANHAINGYSYVAPPAYHHELTRMVEKLQRTVRELLLSDLMASGHEAVPPRFEQLVERYFEVLAHERRPE